MMDPESLSYLMILLLRHHSGLMLLCAAFGVVLPVLGLRVEAGKISLASLVLMLVLPLPIALYAVINGYHRFWHSINGHLMKISEIADLGSELCLLLLLGIVSLVPGVIVTLTLFLRRAFRKELQNP